MALRKLRYQDDEILRKRSKEVEVFDDKLNELLDDMIDTMHEFNGVGLSAVQVGILKRAIVIDVYDGNPPIKLMNPRIVKTKGKQEVMEGCLSFPNEFAKTIRPNEVEVIGQDETGKEIKIKAKELLAQALCHEIDHLDGNLFVDIMEPGTFELYDPDTNKYTPYDETKISYVKKVN